MYVYTMLLDYYVIVDTLHHVLHFISRITEGSRPARAKIPRRARNNK